MNFTIENKMVCLNFHLNISELFILFFLSITFILFPGCAERKMSLEDAKKISISMKEKTFVPPPRRADDIFSMLTETKNQKISTFEFRNIKGFHKMPMASKNPDSHLYKGDVALILGRFNEALKEFRLAYDIKIRRKLIWRLGLAEHHCGNYKRAIEIFEYGIKKYPNDPGNFSYLVKIYSECGDLELAEKYKKRGISVCNRIRFKKGWEVWARVHKARMEAFILDAQGRFKESEKLWRKIYELTCIESDFFGFMVRIGLARNLMKQDRLNEAEIEAREALNQGIDITGINSEMIGTLIGDVGEIVRRQGRLREAEKLMKAGTHIIETAAVIPDSYMMGLSWVRLGNVLTQQHKFEEAKTYFELARKSMQDNKYLFEKDFARNPNLILSYLRTGEIEKAFQLIETAYDANKKSYGVGHYRTAELLGLRAMAKALMNKYEQALTDFANSSTLLIERGGNYTTNSSKRMRLKIIIEAYMDLLATIKSGQTEIKTGIDSSELAFKLADSLCSYSLQNAISAMGARMAASNDSELSDLVRREQDVQKLVESLMSSYANILSGPKEQQIPSLIENMKDRIKSLDKAHAVLLDEIKMRFPKYSNFTNPEVMAISQIQTSLNLKETLVLIYSTDKNTFVWAVPNNGNTSFSVVSMNKNEIKSIVARLRKSLEPNAKLFGDIPEFDLKSSYELYKRLLIPVKDGWKYAKKLFIVAPGPLGHLPFSVLPTENVNLGDEKGELFSRYRKIPWLVRKVALARLPTASSLAILRMLPKGSSMRKEFLGFGDPLFNLKQLHQVEYEKRDGSGNLVSQKESFHIRGIRITDTGNIDDNDAVSIRLENLNRLPDTASELTGIATTLGVEFPGNIFLKKEASEHQVKNMTLSDRRIVAFASHALVPGDLDGLYQPAIALSSPLITGYNEDGLLTMEEILKLKLNADWVILSACNTGASFGTGSEAISGLGRAFFYAGARSILVSMWSIETTSAKELITEIFRRQKYDNTLSRSVALQQSMIKLMDKKILKDKSTGRAIVSYAHPLFWASFIVAGDG